MVLRRPQGKTDEEAVWTGVESLLGQLTDGKLQLPGWEKKESAGEILLQPAVMDAQTAIREALSKIIDKKHEKIRQAGIEQAWASVFLKKQEGRTLSCSSFKIGEYEVLLYSDGKLVISDGDHEKYIIEPKSPDDFFTVRIAVTRDMEYRRTEEGVTIDAGAAGETIWASEEDLQFANGVKAEAKK